DRAALDAREVARAHFRRLGDRHREEAALRQAPLEGHLPALEAHLVVAARARLLALVPAARGLPQARADAAADALARLLRPGGRLDGVQFHFTLPLSSRKPIPRFAPSPLGEGWGEGPLLFNLHQIAHPVDHSADRRRVR